MIYDYLIAFLNLIAGIMTTERLVAISFVAITIYIVWVVVALLVSFQRRFNVYCVKMYNLLKNEPKLTIHETRLNNYAEKISVGFSRGFKRFKNSGSGKPSDYISRSEALDVEVSGGVLNQGKSLMKFFMASVFVLVFVLNLALRAIVASEPALTITVLLESLILPLMLYFVMRLLYYVYTILRQYMYKTDIVCFYDLIDLLDEHFGRGNMYTLDENHAENVEKIVQKNDGACDRAEEKPLAVNENVLQDAAADETFLNEENKGAMQDSEEESEVIEQSEESLSEVMEQTESEEEILSEEETLTGEQTESVEETSGEEKENEESSTEEETVENSYIEDSDKGEEDSAKSEEPSANLSRYSVDYIDLSKYEIKPEDLGENPLDKKADKRKNEPADANNEVTETENVDLSQQNQEVLYDENSDNENVEENAEEEVSETIDLSTIDSDAGDDASLNENQDEGSSNEENSDENQSEEDSDKENAADAANNMDEREIMGGGAYKFDKDAYLEKYDIFKKKNIDVEKLKNEIPSSNNNLPFIDVDSSYVIKDDDIEERRINHEKREEERKKKEEELKLEREKEEKDRKKLNKIQDEERRAELERLFGRKHRETEDEQVNAETSEVEVHKNEKSDENAEVSDGEKNNAGETDKADEQQVEQTSNAEEVNAPAEETVEEKSETEETVQKEENAKVETIKNAEENSSHSNGYELQFTETTKPLTRGRSHKSKLASGGVEIEMNEPRKRRVARQEEHVQELKTSDDVDSILSSIKESTQISSPNPTENSAPIERRKKVEKPDDSVVEIKTDKIDNTNKEDVVQGDIMLISDGEPATEIKRRRASEKDVPEHKNSDIVERIARRKAKETQRENEKESKQDTNKNSDSAENKVEVKKSAAKAEDSDGDLQVEDKKQNLRDVKNEKNDKKILKNEEKIVENQSDKKLRGRPKKQIFDETMKISNEKEFNIALSRAEKLMKKSEEGLSASQSKRIEKELKTLIDAMNRYKEEN